MAKHRATFQGWCPFRGCLHRSESRPTSLERPGSINGWNRPERHRRPSDSSFRAGSRHTRDSCIRGAETAARLTRNALLRRSEIAEARGKTIHREVELHALIDDVNEWDNEHWKAISPPAADGIRPVKPSRRSRRFGCCHSFEARRLRKMAGAWSGVVTGIYGDEAWSRFSGRPSTGSMIPQTFRWLLAGVFGR